METSLMVSTKEPRSSRLMKTITPTMMTTTIGKMIFQRLANYFTCE